MAKKLNCTFEKNSVRLFVCVKLPTKITSAKAFIDELLHEKYLFLTLRTIFGSNVKGYIRFSLCFNEKKILEAIERVSLPNPSKGGALKTKINN